VTPGLRGALLRLCLCALIALLPGGCAEPDGRTQLRYMAWGNPEQLETEKKIIAEFEKRNPELRVKLTMVPGSGYQDKLHLMLASRTAPDVMRVDHYFFPSLVRKEYFSPLEPFIQNDPSFDLDDFFPITLRESSHEGKLYGLNVLFGAIQIYYNKSLFQAAGLEDPYALYRQGRWDWDAFLHAAKRLTREAREGQEASFGLTVPTFPQLASIIYNFGGRLMNDDWTQCAMDDANTIRALQYVTDLRWVHHVAPTPAEAALSAFAFESNRVGMVFGWAGESPRYRKIKSFEWDVVPLPRGPDAMATLVKGNQLVMNRETRHPAEAWSFMKFMTGPDAEMILAAQLRRCAPTRRSVATSPEYLAADQAPFHPDVFPISVEAGRELPITHRWQEWTTELNRFLDLLWLGTERDAAKVMQQAVPAINAILREEEGF
jgi:multiple sugar transport system substrate-binding protein